MNKQDMINAVANATEVSKAAAAKAIDAVFDAVKESLSNGEEVRIIGFGTFKVRRVQAKTVRNPRDGSPVKVPASNRVKFSAGKELKEAANS